LPAQRRGARAGPDGGTDVSTFHVLADAEVIDEVAVIAAAGELDHAVSPELRERLFGQIVAGRRRLLLDFSAVTFIDSTTIGVIVGALSRLRALGGGAIAVACAEESTPAATPEDLASVRKIFQIAGVDAGVAICSSREEALSHLSGTAV
jgi:anti-sigma B factor antagonist